MKDFDAYNHNPNFKNSNLPPFLEFVLAYFTNVFFVPEGKISQEKLISKQKTSLQASNVIRVGKVVPHILIECHFGPLERFFGKLIWLRLRDLKWPLCATSYISSNLGIMAPSMRPIFNGNLKPPLPFRRELSPPRSRRLPSREIS